MKAEEKIAKSYLEGLDLGSVQFEPDGNNPPDFSVGTSIGVEVRRLNQNYLRDGNPRGLEELSIPLRRILHEETSEFDNRFSGKTYLVTARWRRPSKRTGRETARAIRDSLEDFLRCGSQAPSELIVDDHLRLAVCPSKPVQGRVFLFGGSTDRDSGGAVIPMYVKNISHCIREKSRKIAPYEYRYGIWWLLLVDYMDWGIDTRDKAYIASEIRNLERLGRVLVIDKQHSDLRLDLQHGQ